MPIERPDPERSPLRDPRSLPRSPGRWTGRLPHLEKPVCGYFVTFCIRANPEPPCITRHEILAATDPVEVARLSEPVAAASSPLLGLPRTARVVEGALLHFQGQRYTLHSWCVMPDHVHVLVTPFANRTLGEVLHSWKSFTAHEINRMLHRSGPLWQRESFDHLVRSPEGFERFLAYIESNPVTAGLCSDPSEWPFSSARFRRALSL